VLQHVAGICRFHCDFRIFTRFSEVNSFAAGRGEQYVHFRCQYEGFIEINARYYNANKALQAGMYNHKFGLYAHRYRPFASHCISSSQLPTRALPLSQLPIRPR
jgi:hypothetical protein